MRAPRHNKAGTSILDSRYINLSCSIIGVIYNQEIVKTQKSMLSVGKGTDLFVWKMLAWLPFLAFRINPNSDWTDPVSFHFYFRILLGAGEKNVVKGLFAQFWSTCNYALKSDLDTLFLGFSFFLKGSVYAPSFDHYVGDPVEDDIFVSLQ